MRRAAKVDKNQGEIVAALRAVGATVSSLHQIGDGIPDLLVGFRCVNYLLEVKTSAGTLTKDQVKWHDKWRGQKAVVRTPHEALLLIGALRGDTNQP